MLKKTVVKLKYNYWIKRVKAIFTYKGVGYSYIEIDGLIYTFRVEDPPNYDDMLSPEDLEMIEEEMDRFESILREEELKIWKGKE